MLWHSVMGNLHQGAAWLASGFVVLSLQAEWVTFDFGGQLSYRQDPGLFLPSAIKSDSSFSGRISYDTALGKFGATDSSHVGSYTYGPDGFVMNASIAGQEFVGQNLSQRDYRSISIWNDYPRPDGSADSMTIQANNPLLNGQPILPAMPGVRRVAMVMQIDDSTCSMFPSLALPTDPWVLYRFTESSFQVIGLDSNDDVVFLAGGGLDWIRSDSGSDVSAAQAEMAPIYLPGQPMLVQIRVQPAAGVIAYAVEDHLPAGWKARAISDRGVYDEVAGKVKWGIFFDSTLRMLSYQAFPGPEAPPEVMFAGLASFDGKEISIGGIRQAARAEPLLFNLTGDASGAELQLRWEGEWVLQHAVYVQGPWADLITTNRSLAVPASEQRAFFRLRWNGPSTGATQQGF